MKFPVMAQYLLYYYNIYGFGTFHNTEGIVSGGFFAQAKSVRALVPTKKFLLNPKVMLLLLFKRF